MKEMIHLFKEAYKEAKSNPSELFAGIAFIICMILMYYAFLILCVIADIPLY